MSCWWFWVKYQIVGTTTQPTTTIHHLHVTKRVHAIFLNKRECYPLERINLAALPFQKIIQMPKVKFIRKKSGVAAHPIPTHIENTGTWKDKMLLQMPMHTQQLGNPPKGGSFISSTAITLSYLEYFGHVDSSRPLEHHTLGTPIYANMFQDFLSSWTGDSWGMFQGYMWVFVEIAKGENWRFLFRVNSCGWIRQWPGESEA